MLLPGKTKRRFTYYHDKSGGESDHCLFIQRFDEPMETEWKLKKDTLHDIIECLSDEAVKAGKTFSSNQDAFYEEDEEE